MSIQTITFDSKKWKLVPKQLSNELISHLADVLDDPTKPAGSWDIVMALHNAMLAEAPQPETLSPWIPIETAPKDGSNFYVTGFNYGNASNGRWYDVGHVTPRGGIKSTLTWLNLDFATHWMPMPQPPEVK